MSEYRTGTHHGVTICREGDGYRCDRDGHDCGRGHLVAVVVNGDWELAERICALLNGEGEGEGEGEAVSPPAKGALCDAHLSWLCQCPRTEEVI